MKKRLWIYWENIEGRPEPPHISLCRETMYRNAGVPVELVNSENLRDFLPDIHPNIDRIERMGEPGVPCLAIKTAFIRIFLLEKYGGLYLDSDAIVMRDLGEIFDCLEQKDFVCTRKTSRIQHRIPNNFIASRPGGRLISMYANHMRTELSNRTSFEWGEMGADSLTPLVNANREHVCEIPEDRVHPIINNEQEFFADRELSLEEALPQNSLICMLFHGVFDKNHPKYKGVLADYGVRDLYYADNLLGKIFRSVLDEQTFLEDMHELL